MFYSFYLFILLNVKYAAFNLLSLATDISTTFTRLLSISQAPKFPLEEKLVPTVKGADQMHFVKKELVMKSAHVT